MLYQPERFADCLKISCIGCITTNIKICLRTLKPENFAIIIKSEQEKIILNYAGNVLKENHPNLKNAHYFCNSCGHEQYNNEYNEEDIINWHGEDCTFCRHGAYNLMGWCE